MLLRMHMLHNVFTAHVHRYVRLTAVRSELKILAEDPGSGNTKTGNWSEEVARNIKIYLQYGQ